MSKRFLTVAFSVIALGLTVTVRSADTQAKQAEEKFEAKCIVSGAPAKEDSQVAYRGKKLYFCCNNCPKAYKSDPKKYQAKAHHQLLSTEQITLVACPLTGKPLNKDQAVDVAGTKVTFCCPNCKAKVEKAGDKEVDLVFANFDKGFTLQTDCPVSGKPIVADKMVEYKGQKVYFCCPGCPPAFEKSPEKFAAKVPQLVEQEKKEKEAK